MLQDGCTPYIHVHHKQKRSQGGGDIEENLCVLCSKHHMMIEKHEVDGEILAQAEQVFLEYLDLFEGRNHEKSF